MKSVLAVVLVVLSVSSALAEPFSIEDLVIGKGRVAKIGDDVTVDYSGWLTSGSKFDSSIDRGVPFNFRVGARQVIQGWDRGVPGMKVGGKRRLTVPPEMGYGSRGMGPIPANSTLIFEIELLAVR